MRLFIYLFFLLFYSNSTCSQIEQSYIELALAFKNEGNVPKALSCYHDALARNPSHKTALLELGTLIYQHDCPHNAQPYFERLVNIDPQNFQALFYLGACHTTAHNLDQAIAYYQRAIVVNPTSAQTYFCYALVLKKQNNTAAAIEALHKAVTIDPCLSNACYELANIYRDTHDLARALPLYEQALSLQPHEPAILAEQAYAYTLAGKTEQALAIYTTLNNLFPDNQNLTYAMALTFKKHGDLEHAIALYKTLLLKSPDNDDYHNSLGHACLAQGDIKQGYKELAHSNVLRFGTQCLLERIAQIPDKKILITAACPVDDMLQLIRYAKILKELNAWVMVQCNKTLTQLFKQCIYIDEVVEEGTPESPQFHYYIPLLNLPTLFGTTQRTIPAQVPYITVQPELNDLWRKKLSFSLKKIGIYWHNATHYDNPYEDPSVSLQFFAPLTAQLPNAQIFCLQTLNQKDIDLMPDNIIMTHFGKSIAQYDMHTLAAIINNLDVIITCDSTIAHIAGALGKKVFVILAHTTPSRWMQCTNIFPWYPTMRLYRKTRNEQDTASIMQEIIAQLQ